MNIVAGILYSVVIFNYDEFAMLILKSSSRAHKCIEVTSFQELSHT